MKRQKSQYELERNMRIKFMFLGEKNNGVGGKSLGQIGAILRLSRQRIHQILLGLMDRKEITRIGRLHHQAKPRHCKCGIYFKREKGCQSYYCPKCREKLQAERLRRKMMTKEERLALLRERYKNDEGYRRAIRMAMRRHSLRLKIEREKKNGTWLKLDSLGRLR